MHESNEEKEVITEEKWTRQQAWDERKQPSGKAKFGRDRVSQTFTQPSTPISFIGVPLKGSLLREYLVFHHSMKIEP